MDEDRWKRIEEQVDEIKVALVGTPDGSVKGLRHLMDDVVSAMPGLKERLGKLEVAEAKRKGFIAGVAAVASLIGAGAVELAKWMLGGHKGP